MACSKCLFSPLFSEWQKPETNVTSIFGISSFSREGVCLLTGGQLRREREEERESRPSQRVEWRKKKTL